MTTMPTQATPAPTPSRRGWWTVVVLLVAVAASLGWQHTHQSSGEPSQTEVAASTYGGLLRELTFHFQLPTLNPVSYRLLGMNGELVNGRSNVMAVEYQELRTGDIVDLSEGTPRWMIRGFSGGHPLGTQTINGRIWTRYRHSDPILATTMPNGLHVMVDAGDGTWGDLARFAARVPAS